MPTFISITPAAVFVPPWLFFCLFVFCIALLSLLLTALFFYSLSVFRKYVYEVPIARCLARSGFKYVAILAVVTVTLTNGLMLRFEPIKLNS